MWSTISSMRESAERRLTTVRENALAAAQVAQDVLTAAATEENDAHVSSNQNDESDWKNWPEQSNQQPSTSPTPPPPAPEGSIHTPVPLHAVCPPPPTHDINAPFAPIPSKRTARYVVTGIETTATPKSSFLTPPRPSSYNTSDVPSDSAAPPPPQAHLVPHSSVHSGDVEVTSNPDTASKFAGHVESQIQSIEPANQFASPKEPRSISHQLTSESDSLNVSAQPGPVSQNENVIHHDVAFHATGNGFISHDSAGSSRLQSSRTINSNAQLNEALSFPSDAHADHNSESAELEQKKCEETFSESALQNSESIILNEPLPGWGGDERSSEANEQNDGFLDFGFSADQWPEDQIGDDASSFFGVGTLQHEDPAEARNASNDDRSSAKQDIAAEQVAVLDNPVCNELTAKPFDLIQHSTQTANDDQRGATQALEGSSYESNPVLDEATDIVKSGRDILVDQTKSQDHNDVYSHGAGLEPLEVSENSAVLSMEEKDSEIAMLKKNLKAANLEKEAACISKEQLEVQFENVKRELMVLRDEVADCKDDMDLAFAERDQVRESLNQKQKEVQYLTSERDTAVADCKSATENLHSLSKSAQAPEEAYSTLSQELERLRNDLLHVEDERNAATRELKTLMSKHEIEVESAKSAAKENAENVAAAMKKIAILEEERDEAMAAREDLLQEQRNLLEDLQAHEAEVNNKDVELNNIQKQLRDSTTGRDHQKIHTDALASQFAELGNSLESTLAERNKLQAESLNYMNEVEKLRAELNSASVNITEANRKHESAAKEVQESINERSTLHSELNDVRAQFEAVVKERDMLVRQRTLKMNTDDMPQSLKDLADECESKNREISGLQRQLKSASGKIAKLTAMRSKILQQRDDAGARLESAGVEFSALKSKLKRVSAASAETSAQVQRLQEERDEASRKAIDLAAQASKAEALEMAVIESRAILLKVEEDLAVARAACQKSDEAHTASQIELQLSTKELEQVNNRCSVTARELQASRAECESAKVTEAVLRNAVQEEKETAVEAKAAFTQMQIEMNSAIERMEDEKNQMQSEFAAEHASINATIAELEAVRASLEQKDEVLSCVRRDLESSFRYGENVLNHISVSDDIDFELSSIHDSESRSETSSSDAAFAQAFGKTHVILCQNLSKAVHKLNSVLKDAVQMQHSLSGSSERIQFLEEQMAALNLNMANMTSRCESLLSSEDSLKQKVDADEKLIAELQSEKLTLIEDLKSSNDQVYKLRGDLEEMGTALASERSTHDPSFTVEEKKKLLDQLAVASAQMESLWNLSQQSLSADVVQCIIEEVESNGEDGTILSVGSMVTQGFQLLSEELRRLRTRSSEFDEKLSAAQREIDLIWERTELAETERDSARAARDRWEREARSAKEKAFSEAAVQADEQITHLVQELDHAREDISILQDSLEKSETENSNLRSSCDRLTTKVNLTSQQLDDSEEKLAYLQDEVATLKEDLDYAHQRAQSGEQQSGEAHRMEVDRIASELDASREHVAGLEEQVIMLRSEAEKGHNSHAEMKLVMETHRIAEQNLQIALEQLEAEKDTMIERKTMELQQRLDEAAKAAEETKKMVDEASVVKNQLTLRDEEITELRTALGRLADERVELKLELEKVLSRLNHPDGGGQLVDRRVVRQLLVNYFRVGMARRRDVLELMSRMLGFSDSDLVAVGLKRVALTERIGSLLQPPELDGNSLPPLGTVSDKWIEFLMKETEEEEDDF